eukprot:CAMPEP_0167793168 /NCGR_PEP_ID=MMETSP0111_2-20121227/13009_1 /TAXON_ID=91324 /ORGANISM="Lotharella globosa, Strain CCCM811" /LENGTH=118 /DNA_ID=CAMNT_0007686253 /DNA_START=278 /DNA_END=634 /DNA_ORIENTATION=-
MGYKDSTDFIAGTWPDVVDLTKELVDIARSNPISKPLKEELQALSHRVQAIEDEGGMTGVTPDTPVAKVRERSRRVIPIVARVHKLYSAVIKEMDERSARLQTPRNSRKRTNSAPSRT